jgi:hypothetical protein
MVIAKRPARKETRHLNDPRVPFRAAGSVVDFSVNGLKIETENPPPEGEELIFRMRYGGKTSQAVGYVVRKSLMRGRRYRVGIRLEDTDSEFIPRLIDNHDRKREKSSVLSIVAAVLVATAVVMIFWQFFL